MNFLKSTLIVASILAGANAASAADILDDRSGLKDEPVYMPAITWTGFYIGATAGGGWGKTRFDDGAKSNSFDIDGFVGGITLGYNLRVRENLIAGIEADISSGVSGSFGPGNLGQPNGESWNCASGACETDVNWFGTVRGRIGYTFDNLLVYGTGGLAYGHVKSGIDNESSFQVSDTNVGWAAGGGIEYAFAPNWSAKAEFLHVDLGWTSQVNGFRSDAEFDVVRAGINYHLGQSSESLK